MATDLATRGWQRAACPPSSGSAGYALDGNSKIFLPRNLMVTDAYYFPNLATGSMVSSPASTGLSITSATTGGVFNHGNISFNTTSGALKTIDFNYQVSHTTTFTIRGWIDTSVNTPFFFSVANTDPNHVGFQVNNGTIGFGTINSAWSGWVSADAVATTTPGYHYITVTHTAGTLSLYVDGVLQYTRFGVINSSLRNLVLCAVAATGRTLRFVDIEYSNVVRDGSFVPGNILGF